MIVLDVRLPVRCYLDGCAQVEEIPGTVFVVCNVRIRRLIELDYCELWTTDGETDRDRRVPITEAHAWALLGGRIPQVEQEVERLAQQQREDEPIRSEGEWEIAI